MVQKKIKTYFFVFCPQHSRTIHSQVVMEKEIEHAHIDCRNPNLGLATKAKACKVVGQEGSPGITPHALENVRKCKRMNPHTSKGVFTLGV
jgi:hypothetical protein